MGERGGDAALDLVRVLEPDPAHTDRFRHGGEIRILETRADVKKSGRLLLDLDEDIVPPALSERDIDDLVASLASLTSPAYKKAAAIELARRRDLSRTTRSQPVRRARAAVAAIDSQGHLIEPVGRWSRALASV